MAEIKTAGVIAYFRSGKEIYFVLLRKAKTGGWGPPKGKCDPGETELETAVREMYEEAGFRRADFVPGFREVLKYEVEKNGKLVSKELVLFLSAVNPDDLRLSPEHNEAHMATLDEVEVLINYDELRNVFRKAHEKLTK